MENQFVQENNLESFPLGIGTMAWGQNKILGYGENLADERIANNFRACLEGGVRLFDTAEAYGRSEKILGKMLAETSADIALATKYAPFPWRFTPNSLLTALERSLKRLGLPRVGLYQIHFPIGFVPQEGLWDMLAEAVHRGKTQYVGVSNYGAGLMRKAHGALAKRGVKLVSNQVEYSLIHRSPEVDGLLEACRDLDIALIAYSPLGRGVLSGRYSPENNVSDSRLFYRQFGRKRLKKIMPLLQVLADLGRKFDKTPAQVALNWLSRRRNVVLLPGAKTVSHVKTNIEAVQWKMTEEDDRRIDAAASWFKRPVSIGFRPG